MHRRLEAQDAELKLCHKVNGNLKLELERERRDAKAQIIWWRAKKSSMANLTKKCCAEAAESANTAVLAAQDAIKSAERASRRGIWKRLEQQVFDKFKDKVKIRINKIQENLSPAGVIKAREDLGKFTEGAKLAIISCPGGDLYEFWTSAIVEKALLPWSFSCVWLPELKGHVSFQQIGVCADLAVAYQAFKADPPCCNCKWFQYWAANVQRCHADGQELRFACLDELNGEGSKLVEGETQPQFWCESDEKWYNVGRAQKVELEWVQNTMVRAAHTILHPPSTMHPTYTIHHASYIHHPPCILHTPAPLFLSASLFSHTSATRGGR
jgi:hypothetical protein